MFTALQNKYLGYLKPCGCYKNLSLLSVAALQKITGTGIKTDDKCFFLKKSLVNSAGSSTLVLAILKKMYICLFIEP